MQRRTLSNLCLILRPSRVPTPQARFPTRLRYSTRCAPASIASFKFALFKSISVKVTKQYKLLISTSRMFKKQVSELQLPPQQLGLLRQAGYDTIDDLIAATPEQLAHGEDMYTQYKKKSAHLLCIASIYVDLDIPIEASQSILFATQTQRAPPLTQSAATLLSQNLKQYTTYCQPLDALLNGGITPGSILEISGPPGTAKEALAVNITRSFLEAEHEILFVGMSCLMCLCFIVSLLIIVRLCVDMQNMTPAAQLREVLRRGHVQSYGSK